MQVFTDIVTIIWTTITEILNGEILVILDLLPEILNIKKILGYFTLPGMIGLAVGVPTFVISIIFKFLKKQFLNNSHYAIFITQP